MKKKLRFLGMVVEAVWSYHRPAAPSGLDCENDSRVRRKRPQRLRGRHNTDCTSDTRDWRRRGKTNERSSPRWTANCWVLYGPLVPLRKQL